MVQLVWYNCHISADQFYVDEDAKFNPGTKGEAAAITSAKAAA
jgi:hypothetical protein